MSHSINLFFLLLALLLLRVCWGITYNLFLSPLRRVPGPIFAKITPGLLKWKELTGWRTSTIHSWHQRYGHAVRIGPNELSFSNVESVKAIYGQQTDFFKTPAYEFMTMPPIGVFSLIDKNAHSQRRRLLSHAFSQSNILECEPLVKEQLLRLMKHIKMQVGNPLDMLKYFRMLAFDIVGELFLGQSFGGLESGRSPPFLEDADRYFMASGFEYSNPWLFKFASALPLDAVQNFFGARQRLVDVGRKAFYSYIDQYGRISGRRDLLTKILSVKPGTGESNLTDRETYHEVGNLIFAGSDTTSTTLTFLFWELAEHPRWQDCLRAELQEHVKFDSHGLPDFKDLNNLPILDAIVNEANRLHPAALGSLPRETHEIDTVLAGYFVPKKTIVSMQCYTTQRDKDVFPDPDAFRPDRWMSPDGVSNDAKELYMPFSKGSRACLGKNLAIMELKLITATIIKSFKVTSASSTTKDSMATKDFFLLVPKAGRCDLVFTESVEAEKGPGVNYGILEKAI